MSAKTKEKKTRKRYTSNDKKEIVEFVLKHDRANGRGGKSAAVKKFGISPISLATWIKEGGSPAPSVKKRGRKSGSKNVATATKTSGNFAAKLKELTALAAQIDKAEATLDQLRKKFQALKAAL